MLSEKDLIVIYDKTLLCNIAIARVEGKGWNLMSSRVRCP